MYELRPEYGPAKPAPNGAARRGPIIKWHIAEVEAGQCLCGKALPRAGARDFADWDDPQLGPRCLLCPVVAAEREARPLQ